MIKSNVPLPDLTPVLRDLFVHPSEPRGKDAKILFFHLNHTRHCFKKYKKRRKKYSCRGAALGKGVLPHPEDFL